MSGHDDLHEGARLDRLAVCGWREATALLDRSNVPADVFEDRITAYLRNPQPDWIVVDVGVKHLSRAGGDPKTLLVELLLCENLPRPVLRGMVGKSRFGVERPVRLPDTVDPADLELLACDDEAWVRDMVAAHPHAPDHVRVVAHLTN